MLVMPEPLNPRLFYSKQAVAEYNNAVAEYMAQMEAAEYRAKNAKGNKHKSRREQYDDQN